jgi:CheY-like chemotaxis protein
MGGYGNAILSRWPLFDVHHLDLTIGTKKKRGVLQARARVRHDRAARTVVIYNMHLGLAGSERELQLARFLDSEPFRRLHTRTPVVVGGDDQLADFLRRHLGGWSVLTAPDLASAAVVAVEVRAQAILADVDASPIDIHAPVALIRLPLPHGERLSAALGATGHLVKPVTREALQEAVARVDGPLRQVLLVDDDPDFVRLLDLLSLSWSAGIPVVHLRIFRHAGVSSSNRPKTL